MRSSRPPPGDGGLHQHGYSYCIDPSGGILADAAHIHSPLGGQGLNLGIGDAANLGWKLAATVRGTAPEGLLDTYTSEHHPIGAAVLDWSRAQVAIMKPGPNAPALRKLLHDLLRTTDGTTLAYRRTTGLFNRYDLGDTHPLVGRTAPDFRFRVSTTPCPRALGQPSHDGARPQARPPLPGIPSLAAAPQAGRSRQGHPLTSTEAPP